MVNLPPFCCPRVVVPKPSELLPYRLMGGVGEVVVVQRVPVGGVGGEVALLELVRKL